MGGDVIQIGGAIELGVPDNEATVWFGESPKPAGAANGRRVMYLKEAPAFELSFGCGTCAFLFRRESGANQTVSLDEVHARLATGLRDVDAEVVRGFGALLGADRYVPMLLRIWPTLVQPMGDRDYFSHEQIATWGVNGFWGLPEYPSTPYYRTFETPVHADAHLYEFLVPMVPPSWNDKGQVDQYVKRLEAGDQPTAVAVSTLDVCQPATDRAQDYYAHWGLTHFLLDGHHKVEAAAKAGRSVTLLSLLSCAASLCDDGQLNRVAELRRQPESPRSRP